jgi:adenylate cyclase
VRSFTPISERLAPEDLVAFLNRLLGELSRRVTGEDGTIDKYIGDALMAFWNAPLEVPGHQMRACRAALEMRKAVARLNARDAFGFAGRGLPPVEIGIGLNCGPALVGNLGSEDRFDYSCVGDTVNVAARVESACKEVGYDIVVTRAVAEGAPGLAYLAAGSIALKGKSAPEPIFVLVGDETLAGSDAFRALKDGHDRIAARLASGGRAPVASALARLAADGEALAPGLGRFYERLSGRRGDFRTAA